MATVLRRTGADKDVLGIVDWYLEIDPELALAFEDALRNVDAILADFPRIAAEYYGEIRRYAMPDFPYLIWYVYIEESDAVIILNVSHNREDPARMARKFQ